jgi:glutaminyl-tRNA synthetase
MPDEESKETKSNFIRDIIEKDLESGRHSTVKTRFPPEPNGYLHIGHAKSIVLNFGVARDYHGSCNLRFDDTNPLKEEVEYVESIQDDVRWFGYDWQGEAKFASDYFDKLYEYAERLIEKGLAYVDSLPPDKIREYRGTLTEPGKESPYRDRSVEENLDLFRRMRAGEFKDGEHVLRAKIDMASPNMIMRDPTLYRIRHAEHHRTGDKWCIYPMYDYTHCLSDAIEGITHSLCTLEFENNRELYDWVLDRFPEDFDPETRTRQYEFARLNLTYTVLSKRRLIQLVREGHVAGWDDPRMPTITGIRRRGYTPRALKSFCEKIGVAKSDNLVDIAMLEHALREDLNETAPRVMGVTRPVKLVIENYPEDQVEWFDFPYHPEKDMGSRKLPFSRELWVEAEDFKEEAPRKWFRLAPGKEVRLRYGYYVTCTGYDKDETGRITEIRATYDPETRGGWSEDGRKVKGTLHWLSASHAQPAEIRLYDRLFTEPNPLENKDVDFKELINKDSLEVLQGFVEPGLADPQPLWRCQFERLGYFCADPDSKPGKPVFNRSVTLRDTWARVERTQKK